MEKRWASLKLTLVLLYLGVLPLTPEFPLPYAFAFLALAIIAAVPLVFALARTVVARVVLHVQSLRADRSTHHNWQLYRPQAPGTRGTVRSRAPSAVVAA